MINKQRLITLSLLLPGFIIFLGLFFYPMLITVITSLRGDSGLSLKYYIGFLGSGEGLYTIGLSLLLATSATVLAIFLSLPLIMILRKKIRGDRIFRLVILTPLLVPGLISALGLYLFWNRWGWVNLFLTRYIPFVTEPIRLNFTIRGLIIFYTWLFFPYVALSSLSAIESISKEVEEAAAVTGATRWQIFRYILLPLTIPGIMTGSIFTFILSFGALSFPLILGGDYRPYIIASRIYTHVAVFREWGSGSAMAIVMAVVQIVLIFLYLKFSRRRVA